MSDDNIIISPVDVIVKSSADNDRIVGGVGVIEDTNQDNMIIERCDDVVGRQNCEKSTPSDEVHITYCHDNMDTCPHLVEDDDKSNSIHDSQLVNGSIDDTDQQHSIIISNDSIVFSSGTLMTDDDDHTVNNDNPTTISPHDNTNRAHFNIKIERKPLMKSLDTNLVDDDGMNDSNMDEFVNRNEFQVQSTLGMNSVDGLQKICNDNVMMSEALVPPVVGNKDYEIIIHSEGNDNKQYLQDSNSLFIKNEVEVREAPIKSEGLETSYQPVIFLQIDGEDGNPQFVAITETVSSNDNTNFKDKQPFVASDITEKRKKQRQEKRIKPFNRSPKNVNLEEKFVEKTCIGGKSLPMIVPKVYDANGDLILCSKALKFNLGSLMGQGHYFEVLGRCTHCFRFSRTTAHCRADKRHREPKSAACVECESAGRSTLVCRRNLNHKAPNALPINVIINTATHQPENIRQLCVKNQLPPCFGELQSIVVHHAEIPFVGVRTKTLNSNEEPPPEKNTQRRAVDYARGYLFPYTKEKWMEWLDKYCKQTQTDFRIRTGKRVNKKSDHGIANHNGKIVSYRTLETQLYNCALGGKPRNRLPKDGVRKRKGKTSKLIGCTAVVHTRVIITETNWKALEITAPKLSAHLSCHDPRVDPHMNMNDLILVSSDVIDDHHKQSHLDVTSPTQQPLRFDFMPETNSDDVETDFKKEVLCDEKKRVKNLLLTCAGMIDMLDNEDVLAHIQDNTQTMLSKVLNELNTNATKLMFSKTTQTPDDVTATGDASQIDEITNMM